MEKLSFRPKKYPTWRTRALRRALAGSALVLATGCAADQPDQEAQPPAVFEPAPVAPISPSPVESLPSPSTTQTNEACGIVPVLPGTRLEASNLDDVQKQLDTLRLALAPSGTVGFRDPDRALSLLTNAKIDPEFAANFAAVLDNPVAADPNFKAEDMRDSRVDSTLEYCAPADPTADPIFLTQESAAIHNRQILALGQALGTGLGEKLTDQTSAYIRLTIQRIEPYAQELVDNTAEFIRSPN